MYWNGRNWVLGENLDYDSIWDNAAILKGGHTEEYLGFEGEFNVKVLTGSLKIFNQIYKHWKKVIRKGISNNIINGKPEGFFYVRNTILPFLPFCLGKNKEILYLDYAVSKNTRKWNRMLDNIRKVCKDVYIGEVYFRIFRKKYIFLGYFSLVRKGINFDEKTFKVIEPAQLEEG